MARSFPNSGRAARVALAGLLALALASCREIAIVADVVFPTTVPGLPSDQPWESLPLRRWMTEAAFEPVAISACFTCREPAVAGLFRARGKEAEALRGALRNPAALLGGQRFARSRQRGGPRPVVARVAAEPAREGGLEGAVLRATRPDGKRGVAVYAMLAERPGETSVVVIVAPSEASARQLARGIAPRL